MFITSKVGWMRVRLKQLLMCLSTLRCPLSITGTKYPGRWIFITLLVCLAYNKSEDIYALMWNEIQILCTHACYSNLIVDFEQAAINTFYLDFHGTQIKGSFFHLTQNLFRKIKIWD